ncbi:MAG: sulfatase-like hydrolase/transferase, partial [Planctomycetales bacterium]|nr:sulfatase-like hydrolase/transferase [Planctomycetales bacterium]
MKPLLSWWILLCVCYACSAQQRPNIVFIEVDDLTYKYVGAFGAEHIQTPRIDELAQRGVLFENAIVQGCMCAPSRNSLMTGRYPQNLGLYSNGDIRQMPAGQWAFPTALQTAGYHTSWIGKSHILPYVADQRGRGGLKKTNAMKQRMGFDEVWQSAGRHVALKRAKELAADPQGKWKRNADAYADYLYDNHLLERFIKDGVSPTTLKVDQYLDGFIAKQSADWIRGYQGDQPFFLWVNFSGPHGPYNPPREYLQSYESADMPPAIRDDDHSDIPRVLRPHEWRKLQGAIGKQRGEYAGMISFIDEQVGRVVDAVRTKGVEQDTVIVFFSDHGIMEGDHGLMHKETLYKEVLNACLVVVDPQGPSGARVARPVELLDLVKTSLDWAGAMPQASESAFGESLLPLLRGKEAEYKRRFAVAQINGATTMVTQRYKYIHTADGPVLFDLASDPDERENVAEDQPALCQRFESAFAQWKA